MSHPNPFTVLILWIPCWEGLFFDTHTHTQRHSQLSSEEFQCAVPNAFPQTSTVQRHPGTEDAVFLSIRLALREIDHWKRVCSCFLYLFAGVKQTGFQNDVVWGGQKVPAFSGFVDFAILNSPEASCRSSHDVVFAEVLQVLGGDECKVHFQKGSLWRSHGRNVEGLLWSSRPTWIVGVRYTRFSPGNHTEHVAGGWHKLEVGEEMCARQSDKSVMLTPDS